VEEDKVVVGNYRAKELAAKINNFRNHSFERESGKPFGDKPIQIPGIGYNSCTYSKMLEEEKLQKLNRKRTPLHDRIELAQKMVKGVSKHKRQEELLFKRLKQEMEAKEVKQLLGSDSPVKGEAGN